jgi:glutamate/aspartate transport system permease protein
MNYQWDWRVYLQDTGGGQTYLHWMMSAWGWTIAVAVLGWVVALTAGSLVGVLRTVPNRPLQWLSDAWVELFRNVPLLVQVFLWYHVIPAIFPPMKALPSFVLVVFALGFFTSARVAEQVRAGIQSLPRGQMMAGSAMGLTLPQTYRHVILPMAFRIILPPLTSEAMNIVKNSSVAFAVSIPELIQFAMQAQEETSRGIEIYLGATGLYIVTAFAVNRLMAAIEHRLRLPGTLGGSR